MKTKVIAILLSACVATSVALAEDEGPITLTADQMDEVTAGTGANNAAPHVWPKLFSLGFKPAHNVAAEGGADHSDSLNGVLVPTRNPNGVPDGHPGCPIAYCSSPPGQL